MEWELFDSRWREVLAKYGITDLHMRDYESAWGEYKGWDRPRRIELLSALIDTFEESAAPPSTGLVGFWSALPLHDYELA
ncbi:MAG: hypothetical protein DMG58_31245 [Acidobacteria bacterium]|nr:MAG: hypothetical protein DMG58_31245 [Acidobacteriota bacterium]